MKKQRYIYTYIVVLGVLLFLCLYIYTKEKNGSGLHEAHFSDMHHGELVLEEAPQPIPYIKILSTSARSGMLFIDINVGNYTFTDKKEELYTAKNISAIEGHLHIYINNKKYVAIYTATSTLSLPLQDLPLTHNIVEVTLNAPDHRIYTYGGKRISDTIQVTSEGRRE